MDISGEDDDDDDSDDDNSYYGLEEEDTEMQDSPAAKKAVKMKPPASKPDPTAAITIGLTAASLSQPKFVWYDLSIKFPVTVSPKGYFRDGQMRICVDFQGIGMDFENYGAETSGKTLKLGAVLIKN